MGTAVQHVYAHPISSKHPQALPELISCHLFIVKVARKFKYPSRLCYDTEYRKWAAATQYQELSGINTQLYSLAPAKVTPCHDAQVEGGNHTFDCPRYPIHTDTLPPQHHNRPPRPLQPPAPKRLAVDHCISYNLTDGNCKFGPSCRYPHKCAVCGFLGLPIAQTNAACRLSM